MKFEELQIIISEVFHIDKRHISIHSTMNNIDKWDSIGHLNLIIAIEEKSGVRFTPEQISKMISIKLILGEFQ